MLLQQTIRCTTEELEDILYKQLRRDISAHINSSKELVYFINEDTGKEVRDSEIIVALSRYFSQRLNDNINVSGVTYDTYRFFIVILKSYRI